MPYQKYHAKPTEVNGIRFASKLEARRYSELMDLLAVDEISNLKLQVEFVLVQGYVDPYKGEREKEIKYIADFMYIDNSTGRIVVEDTKGVETPTFRMKWRMAKENWPTIDWRIIKSSDVRY